VNTVFVNTQSFVSIWAKLKEKKPQVYLPEPIASNLLAPYLQKRPHIMERVRQTFQMIALSAMLIIMVFLCYEIRDSMQPAYFASLPQPISHMNPIAAYSLQRPEVTWSTWGKRGEVSYDDSGMTLVGKSNYSFNGTTLLLPTVYNATAMQVTLTIAPGESWNDDGDYGTAAGIVVRVDQQNKYDSFDNCQFVLDGAGRITIGNENGYHRFEQTVQVGKPVTILLISRGRLLISYVNGQYLGSYSNRTLTGAGQVGLRVLGENAKATFRDLKIWQLTQPPVPWFV
jgi:hypothetical protein